MALAKISFPGLGINNLELNSVAFSIGKIDIAWYALIIVFGMILCVAYIIFRAKGIGLNAEQVLDYTIFVIPFGILGARLYYVIMKIEEFDSLAEVFNIRNGGLAIYGGIIAGTLTVYIVSKIKKVYFPAMGDCVVPGLILAQSIGRWGNFVNVEAYGSVTSLPWRMSGNGIASSLLSKGIIDAEQYADILSGTLGVHPTFLYESLWNIIGFILINVFYKHKKYDGQAILLVFGWYGLGRMLIEGLRTDSLYLFGSGIRVSQLLAGILFVGCTSLLVYFRIKPPKREKFVYQIKNNDNEV